MIRLEVSSAARGAYAGWRIGLLEIEDLFPRGEGAELDAEVALVEKGLASRFGGLGRKELARTEPARLYAEHFARSGKAYPVLLQAEGAATKGRRIAMGDPLVRAMFAAELEGMLLTAGHDLDALKPPLHLELASGSESMPTLGGSEKAPPPGDLVMRDELGIFASVLLGPDSRTSIAPTTSRLLFVIYAPPGLAEESILRQAARLAELAALACPSARAGALEITEL